MTADAHGFEREPCEGTLAPAAKRRQGLFEGFDSAGAGCQNGRVMSLGPSSSRGGARSHRLAGALAICVLALSPPATILAEEVYVVEMTSYALRDAPKSSAKIIGRVRVGQKVAAPAREGGWVLLDTGEHRGWIPESGVGAEEPALARVGPLEERVAALESERATLASESRSLREERGRASSRVAALESELAQVRGDKASSRTMARVTAMALGGALVIVGWIAGWAFASRGRSRGGTRYRLD